MNEFLLVRIVTFSLCIFFIIFPGSVSAGEITPLQTDSESQSEIVADPGKMTQKQMNDLFGEDPYLGQTSYLQSPDGFSQRDKSK